MKKHTIIILTISCVELDRNYLKAEDGDRLNATLTSCGFNFRKVI